MYRFYMCIYIYIHIYICIYIYVFYNRMYWFMLLILSNLYLNVYISFCKTLQKTAKHSQSLSRSILGMPLLARRARSLSHAKLARHSRHMREFLPAPQGASMNERRDLYERHERRQKTTNERRGWNEWPDTNQCGKLRTGKQTKRKNTNPLHYMPDVSMSLWRRVRWLCRGLRWFGISLC